MSPRRQKRLGNLRILGAAAVVLMTMLVSIPAGAVSTPPDRCAVNSAGGASLEVDWPTITGAVAYVIYRSVDNSPDYWRGRTSALSFTDTDRSGDLRYSVVAIDASGERSTPTACTDEHVPVTLTAPTACVVTSPAADLLTISWQAGSGAADYIVSRSVDGGPVYWRGRVGTLSFADTDRNGALSYSVIGRAASGQRSDAAPCTDQRETPLQAPPSCHIIRNGPATLDVRWTAAGGASSYIVYRSVDGNGPYWRTRTSDLSYLDDDRVAALAYTVASVSPSGDRSTATPCANEQPQPDTIDLVAVGDMVQCNGGGAQRVSDLLDRLPGRILGLGDFAYQSGSAVEFENCFDPIFGHQRERFDPVPGNHEYYTPGAAPYFAYFGAAAGDPTKGYYERNVGNWQILGLNSNCGEIGGCHDTSPQGQWLAQQLAAAPPNGVCRIAFMHHPRLSSYELYDNALFLAPLHQQLFDAGTDMVITGHAHHYERFVPIQPDGAPNIARGIANFTVGTGGIPLRSDLVPKANSDVRITDAWGVLDLDLRDSDYSWRFVVRRSNPRQRHRVLHLEPLKSHETWRLCHAGKHHQQELPMS